MDLRIQSLLPKEAILPQVSATSKQAVLHEMVQALSANYPILDDTEIRDRLMQREALSSTGIGEGVAIPHCRTLEVDVPRLVLARSLTGIDYQAVDDKPVFLLFLLVAPERADAIHLKVLAKIAKLCKQEGFIQDLLAAEASAMYSVLLNYAKKVD